jgi:hypothetical protein
MKSIKYLAAICSLFFIACSTGRNSSPSRIGIVPLSQYSLAAGQTVTDTTYKVFTNEADFNATIVSSGMDIRRPDFNGQTAIAILLPFSSAMQFDSAEVVNRSIYVYAWSCTPASSPNCTTGSLFVASVPKVGSATKIQFFINGISRRTIGF